MTSNHQGHNRFLGKRHNCQQSSFHFRFVFLIDQRNEQCRRVHSGEPVTFCGKKSIINKILNGMLKFSNKKLQYTVCIKEWCVSSVTQEWRTNYVQLWSAVGELGRARNNMVKEKISNRIRQSIDRSLFLSNSMMRAIVTRVDYTGKSCGERCRRWG